MSEFRQSWIDSLRRELSEFAGNARRISFEKTPLDLAPIVAKTPMEHIEAANRAALREDPFHENRLSMAQSYYAIRLRLNPLEPDHQALLIQLDKIYGLLNSRGGHDVIAALDEMFRVAQPLLKREWIRVKNGELTFRLATQGAKWVSLIFAASIVGIVSYFVWRTSTAA